MARRASGPPANVAPEIPGADHRQAASSTRGKPGVFLRVCVLAWRRRHPGLSSTTFTGDPLGGAPLGHVPLTVSDAGSIGRSSFSMFTRFTSPLARMDVE
jgi:hypothetical protein